MVKNLKRYVFVVACALVGSTYKLTEFFDLLRVFSELLPCSAPPSHDSVPFAVKESVPWEPWRPLASQTFMASSTWGR